jgi:hypothetical protein
MPGKRESLVRLDVLVSPDVRRRLEERAEREHVSLGALTRSLVDQALEADLGHAEGAGGAGLRRVLAVVEEVREEVRDHATMIGAVGSGTIALQQLLAHWATRESLGISEDELLAEMYVAGHDGWRQVLEDLRDPEPRPAEKPGEKEEP